MYSGHHIYDSQNKNMAKCFFILFYFTKIGILPSNKRTRNILKKIKLQTLINVAPISEPFEYGVGICGIGSCFAQDMLSKLYDLGFKGMQNPNGIVYNCHSMAYSLSRCATQDLYTESDFFEFNGKWCSWEHHGSFSDPDLHSAITGANDALISFRESVKTCSLFVITPSSSVVYETIKECRIVANCHKVPNNKFNRRLLSIDENLKSLLSIIESVRTLNKECKIVITLSPVRHYKGDLVLNSRSKANLISAIHSVVELCGNLDYFPSYEILLDELRDYRFFNEDMLHPNELARKIIYNRFINTYFSENAQLEIDYAEKRYRSSLHRKL